jgi:hypothetical protein
MAISMATKSARETALVICPIITRPFQTGRTRYSAASCFQLETANLTGCLIVAQLLPFFAMVQDTLKVNDDFSLNCHKN